MLRRADVCLLLLSAGLNGTAKEISFLTIAYPGELTKYLQDEVIPMFRRMHNADVSLLTANWNTRMERIIVLTAGGTPPDVVVTGFYSPYEEGASGMLEPLNRYLERWPLTSRLRACGCPELAETSTWCRRISICAASATTRFFMPRPVLTLKNLPKAGLSSSNTRSVSLASRVIG